MQQNFNHKSAFHWQQTTVLSIRPWVVVKWLSLCLQLSIFQFNGKKYRKSLKRKCLNRTLDIRLIRRILGLFKLKKIVACILIILGVFLSIPAGTQAAITFVQTKNGNNNGATSVSATFDTAPTENNLLVAIVGNRDNSTPPTTPSGWSVAISETSNTPGQVIFYKIAGASESSTVTVSNYGTSTNLGIHIYEYSGISTSSPLDQTNSTSGNSATASTGSITTTYPDELLIAGLVSNDREASFSSWTNSFTEKNDFHISSGKPGDKSGFGGADRIVNATGTYSTSATVSGSGAWRGQIVSFNGTQPSLTQSKFRGRKDDGNETGAGWKAAADTNWTQKVDENFRVRFVVQETVGISAADKTFQLEYNRNGGGWNDVNGTSSVVQSSDSTYLTDGADTTQQIGSGTEVGSNNDAFDDVSGLAGSTNLDFAGDDEVEVEYSVQIISADVANDDTIQLRVKGLDSWTSTPTVTVSGITEFDQDSFRGRNDDGNETAATWKALANTNWNQVMDTTFRVRFVVQETGDGAAADKTFQLEYNHNAGGWNDVTNLSSVVRAWASGYVGDGADTTQQVGSGTPVGSNNDAFDSGNGLAGSTNLDFSGSDEVEVEYSVQIRSADVSASDTIQLRVKGLDSWTNTPTVTATSASAPVYDQDAFRGRNDNGNETAATWKAAADTNWTQKVDENFRVRFVVQEINGISATDKTFQLEYNRNGGGWNDVTDSSSVVKSLDSTYLADGADTTQQVGSGTYVSPNAGFDDVNGQAGGTALDFAGSDEVEVEYCVQIISADVANDDTIQLRVKGLDTYAKTPTVTVTGILEFVQDSFRARNNDGSESAATWIAVANVNWTQPVESEYQGPHFRVRFLVRENGGVSAADKTFQLEYKLNAGSWNDVTGASAVIRANASGYLTEGEDTIQRIGSGTFISNNDGVDETNGQAGGTVLDFVGGDEVELEFSLRILGDDVSNSDTIQLRIKGLDTYSNTPTITVEDCTFSRYRQITIQSSQVQADLTNFPVMIVLTTTEFQVIENDVTDAQGDDIIFKLDSSGEQLSHEIEAYDTSTDLLVAWVKVPNLYDLTDVTLTMWYGNECITTPDYTQDAAGVWSNGYEAVYHLHDDWNDSTGSHNGTGGQTRGYVGGQIGNGVDFEAGNSDYINIGTWSVIGNKLTLQAWIEYESFADKRTLIDKSSTSDFVWSLGTDRQGSNYRAEFNMPGSDLNGSTTFSTNTMYFVVGKYDGSASRKYIRINGSANTDESQSGDLTENSDQVRIGDRATGGDQPFDGIIDEVRISSVARSNAWLNTEYNNMSSPSTFYTVGNETAATVISLVSFTAKGDGDAVKVEWETASEFDNIGFHLYRAPSPGGPYTRLTDKLISARPRQGQGTNYSFLDSDVSVGSLYYYKLEDIDVHGKRTMHGPISVDWDGDGLPDDWEITHGLSPWVNDADLDFDGDGLSNFEEYERDLDPFNPDTDGDGTPDGEEDGRRTVQEDNGSRSISRGVEVLASDESGMTLALNTGGFEAEVVTIGGAEYERLYIADYVHGYTSRVGSPQLPLKGLLIDVPANKAAELTVLNSRAEPYGGYRIYPVPEAVLDTDDGMAAVAERFVQDDLAYSTEGFYPQDVAWLGQSYLFRDQVKQQIIFYPLRFNPASGQLQLHRRIELRIDFVDATYARLIPPVQMPWQPSQTANGLLSSMAMGFAAAPVLINPISPILASLNATVTALWSPPAEAQGGVYKILTDAEGIYRITKDYLDAGGVDTYGINLSQVRIYYLGDEIAIDIFDQNSNDHLDAADTIRFYAQPVSSAYAKYSAQNVYWLTLSGGGGAPLRMSSIASAPAGGLLAADFTDAARHEKDQVIWLKAPGADSIERWFFNSYVQGDEHAGGGLPVAFTIAVPDPTSAGSLTILMAGQTDTDHEVHVVINGAEQSFSWSGIGFYQANLDNVPLIEGDNTVTLQCLSADGNDSIIVDWFEVAYQRDYVAGADNTLKFAPDSGSRYLIDGFSDNTLLAYDISNPNDVAKIENAVISGANPYRFEFEPATAGSTYLVLASEVSKTPVGLIEDTAADLALNASGADYILITHRDLGWDGNGDAYGWLEDLAALRQAQGLRVAVVDIEDIYDEFSYGIKSPRALKDFLSYAYSSWEAPAPQYVLLAGDSTYDPKDHWNEADGTAYLPTYLMFTDFKGETVTDQWFVTFSGEDAVADMHLGRLPAADAAQAAVMVAKIIAYETAPNTQTWTHNLLLVADNQRPGQAYAYEAVFETINEEAAALIPAAMADPFRGYLNDYAATAFLTDDIIDTLNDGVLMVNYAGHGATQILAEEHIFDAADVAALTNTDRLPFFVSMSCETGFFAYPETWAYPSLAEALLRSQAGAVAALMPTGMTATEGQQVLDAALFEAIFKKDIRTLGPAIAEAKQTLLANGDAYFEQIADTFMLFGDPATALKIPLPHIPTGVSAHKEDDGVHISWQAVPDCNNNPVAGYNIYRAGTAAGPFSKINIELITDTVFVDSDGGIRLAAAGSGAADSGAGYYVVTALDAAGFESVQSLAVKPAALGSAAAEIVACFITTAVQPAAFNIPFKALFIIVSIIIGFLLLQAVFKPQSKKNAARKKMNPFNELKNVKTLLVDDDELIRDSLGMAFTKNGCCLQLAETAEEGLQAIKDHQFDIIISDLRLPGINGLDFLKLTAVTQPQAVKFLITAYRDDHIFSEAIRLGVHEFIEKPFSVKVFINLLALSIKRQAQKQAIAGI